MKEDIFICHCFHQIIDDFSVKGAGVCAENMDMEQLKALSDFVCSVQAKYGNCEVKKTSGSTDANIPHSMGIPAICVGVYIGGGAHTTEEWLLKESLKPGFAIGMELILTEGEL